MDKANANTILEGIQQGKSQTAIAIDLKVSQKSISRFLAKIRPYFHDLNELTVNRGNILALMHTKSLIVMNSCLDELVRIFEENAKKDPTKRLTGDKILDTLRGVGLNQGILFDKLRLESGQSTSNIGIAGLINHSHKTGLFDERTGEFKASVVGPLEKNASTHANALKHGTRNELATHETSMDRGD